MKKLLSSVLIILVAVLLAGFLLWDQQEKNKRSAYMEQLQREAFPYIQEINAIRLDIQNMENQYQRITDVSGVIIGFVPASANDLATVKKLIAGYEFEPLMILDCAKDEAVLQDIARKTMEEGWEMIPAGITFDQTVLERSNAIRAFLPALDDQQEPVFLLRHTFDTDRNREQLRQHGYQRLIRYSDDLSAGVDGFGVPYISYGFVRAANSSSGLINRTVAAHTFMTILFDFADIDNGTINEAIIAEFLEAIDIQVSAGELAYTDLTEAFAVVVESESLSRKRQEELEQYKAEQQKRIDELQEMISEIYHRQDGL